MRLIVFLKVNNQVKWDGLEAQSKLMSDKQMPILPGNLYEDMTIKELLYVGSLPITQY